MDTGEFKKNYLSSPKLSEHSKLVLRLSVKLFAKLLSIFPELKKYDNKKDLILLQDGALLHDIGVMFERSLDRPHNKIGRDLILENKISGLDDIENLIVANIVRYHRKSLPDIKKHKIYAQLDENSRRKVDVFASIVRLADALDYNHFNMVDDFKLEYDENKRVLTITPGVNIMLNIGFREILNKKKKFFEKVFNVEVLFK